MHRKRIRVLTYALAASGFLGAGCSQRESPSPQGARPVVVAMTSVLECAVREIGGNRVDVCRILPPRSCPGHFDLRPQDFERIADSALVLRHDYQSHLDRKLKEAGAKMKRIAVVPTTGPQTTPEHFVAVCQIVCQELRSLLPEHGEEFSGRLQETEGRMAALGAKAQADLSSVKGKPVLASLHQKGFCEWCGLRVVATFDASGDMSLKELGDLVTIAEKEKVAAVAANLQRGTREADALAERLSLPVVVLSNFPDPDSGEESMADLILKNCQKVISGIPHD